MARDLEAALKKGRPDSLAKTREALEELARMFADEHCDNHVGDAEVFR